MLSNVSNHSVKQLNVFFLNLSNTALPALSLCNTAINKSVRKAQPTICEKRDRGEREAWGAAAIRLFRGFGRHRSFAHFTSGSRFRTCVKRAIN